MLELVLAVALAQPCLAAKPHKHRPHEKPLPAMSCATPPPMLPAAAPEPDPEPLPAVLLHYIYLPVPMLCTHIDPETFGHGWDGFIGGHRVAAPEIDPASGGAAVTLLLGGLVVLRARGKSV